MGKKEIWLKTLTEDGVEVFYQPEIPLPTVEVAYEEYEQLLKDQSILRTLMDHGVENWQGYEKAIDNMNSNDF